METVRINVRRLAMYVLLTIVMPLTIVILLDIILGWMPILTIVATIILIPLSTVLIVRATLAEMDTVIQTVAPLEPDHNE